MLELGRRRLLASEGEQRVWGAALLGALLAVLGSNLLDLGQSQTTFPASSPPRRSAERITRSSSRPLRR